MKKVVLVSCIVSMVAAGGPVAAGTPDRTEPDVPLGSRRAQPTTTAVTAPIRLASTSDAGVKGDGASNWVSMSASGRKVAFGSTATTLDPADTDSLDDIYVKDVITGDMTLASTSDLGVKGNHVSSSPALSRDGTTVAFRSLASNLDPADPDTTVDVFVKDLASGDVTLASTSSAGVKGNATSDVPSLDRTGGSVAFQSFATTLDPADPDALLDIYVKDLATGVLTLASTSSSGVKGNGWSTQPSLSNSGDRVAFTSEASNLDPLDTDTVDDVYVKVLSTGDLFLVSVTQAGVKGNGVSNALSISGSGRKVAFSSQSTNLDPADTDTVSDIYVKDLTTGELTLASTSDSGVKASAGSAAPAISGDGRRVAFQTTASLDPSDTGGDLDVYVKDLVTGDVVLVSASSEGVHSNDRSELPAISGEGRRVAFESLATNLHPDDTDSIRDVYVKQPVYCTSLGTAGDDVIAGTPGDDILCGGEGADTLQGRGGDDLLLGEGGDDVLVGGAGADVLDGGAGVDTADYGPSPAGVIVFLEGTGSGGHADGDTYPGVEDVQGTPFPDELYGDAGPNALLGGDGLDILAGDEGDDALFGEEGEDFLAGGPGADAKDGGPGSDFATYGESPGGVSVSLATGSGTGSNAEGDTVAGVESLSGTSFDDVLEGDAGSNELLGGQGNDLLTGDGGADTLAGDQGLDVVAYGASPAPVTADLTAQTVSGGDATGDVISGIEGVLGSAFDDTLIGSAGQNAFVGMAGADVIDGGGGTDLLSYQLSPAGVTVDLAAQTATGGHATGDVISGFEDAAGSELADILAGSVGANLLLGYGGDDTLYGLDGDDTLVGAGGTDTFFGGTGTDTCDDTGGESATSCEL